MKPFSAKLFRALLVARNLEFIRDRGSLIWTFAFPLLIILGCTFAFSRPDTSVFSIGVLDSDRGLEELQLLQRPYVRHIAYANADKARQRVRLHQLDLFLQSDGAGTLRYWVNPGSGSGQAARELLLNIEGDWQFEEQQLPGRKVRYVDWVIPGVLAMNMMFSSLFGVGYVIVRYRQNGVLKRLQATPVTPFEFVCAQLLSRLLIVLLVNVSIFIGCNWALDLVVLGSYSLLFLIAVLSATALTSLGLLVASRTASEEFAGGLLNATTWPMMFFSQVWFSLDDAPDWMVSFSQVLPLTHVVAAARNVMIENASLADISHHLLILAAMTFVFTVLAARLFRWHKD